jgi:uncharacterized secreted protein with C-terminal beta-propeller domain
VLAKKQEAMYKLSISRKSLGGAVLLAVIFGVSIMLAVNLTFYRPETAENIPENGPQNIVSEPSLPRFASYDELKTFVSTTTASVPYQRDGLFNAPLSPPAPAAQDGAAEKASTEYSKTNVQVEGVDEADIVKSDGTYVYIVSGENITIVKAYPPEEAQVVASISLDETVTGIFVNEDKLVVFSNSYSNIYPTPPLWPEKDLIPPNIQKTSIRVYNVENRADPRIVRDVTLDGNYFESRMIGDYVYVVITESVYLFDGNIILPTVESNGVTEKIEATNIYYSNVTDYSYAFTTIAAVNVKDDNQAPTHETFVLGYAGEIYVSPTNIYFASPGYFDGTQNTSIHRIHVSGGNIVHEANGTVPGYVLNQFSMDEHKDYFRIATTTNDMTRFLEQSTTRNSVYVLDANLDQIGKLEDLAPGESIYSARFMGERCYLVTFKKVDPLFVIDLSDPANPSVLGKLKIPGYSDYLHPYDDNHLIGIGKNTEEAEEGDFAWYQGIKISIFDVTDVTDPKEVAVFSIGDRGTDSPILRDHKALLFDKERGLLAIPVLLAEIDESDYANGVPPYAYGEYVWQGLYVLNVNENSITLKGRISHIEDAQDYLKAGYYFSSEYSVQRSLYINDVLYTISPKMLKLNSLTDLSEIVQIKLP